MVLSMCLTMSRPTTGSAGTLPWLLLYPICVPAYVKLAAFGPLHPEFQMLPDLFFCILCLFTSLSLAF